MKKTVLFKGPVLTQSGYGVHARQVAKWLLRKEEAGEINVKFSLTPWGNTPWLINQSLHNNLVRDVMLRSVGADHKADVAIMLQLPNEWTTNHAGFNVGMTAGVETDRCNPTWIDACNKMSMVIVPSQHSKQCFTSVGGLTTNIHVVPESYSEAIDGTSSVDLDRFPTPFNFLLFGQVTGNNPDNDRKNIFYTIKWMCEAFANDPDVGIVVKTNSGRNTKIDRNVTTAMFKQLLAEVKKGPFPKVYLLHGDLNDEEVAAFYKHDQIKALVSLTRGEGFGLPILEAAASGLPVIATNWSGHLDFMNKGKFINVAHTLSPVHKSRVDGNIFMPNAKWANASEQDFKQRIQKFKSSSTIPREWATDLQKKIHDGFSFEKICEHYDRVLGEVLK